MSGTMSLPVDSNTTPEPKAAEAREPDALPERAAPSDGSLPRRIELNLRDISQLFNSMDPSPFHEKDLDHDAEDFIVSWAQEFHRREPVELVVHLQQFPEVQEQKPLIGRAVRHYFAYRAGLNAMEFRRLMKQGRASLLIGLPFLAACLLISELLAVNTTPGTLLSLATQSLAIAGWVAMARPMEIYLYEWWPLRRRGQVFEKLSRMNVEVRKRK